MMRLIFLGTPGAGKGTVATLLDERLKIAHLSSGDMLRDAVRDGDPMGAEISRSMRSGALVPDTLITGFILKQVEQFGRSGGFVLDGFPRTVEQARELDEDLARRGNAPIDLAIDFQVSPETVVQRLVGRRVCEKCRVNYHVERIPPKKPGICDRCGSSLQVRADDKPETVEKRLAVFEEQTAPLLDFYKKQGKLRMVSGDQRIGAQYQELIDLLGRERLLAQKA